MKLYVTGFLLVFLTGLAPAFAQTISITVNNIDRQDLFVEVVDQSQGQVVFTGLVRQGAGAPVSISADGNGIGSIGWVVTTTTTPQDRSCNTAGGLTDGSQVPVRLGLPC